MTKTDGDDYNTMTKFDRQRSANNNTQSVPEERQNTHIFVASESAERGRESASERKRERREEEEKTTTHKHTKRSFS